MYREKPWLNPGFFAFMSPHLLFHLLWAKIRPAEMAISQVNNSEEVNVTKISNTLCKETFDFLIMLLKSASGSLEEYGELRLEIDHSGFETECVKVTGKTVGRFPEELANALVISPEVAAEYGLTQWQFFIQFLGQISGMPVMVAENTIQTEISTNPFFWAI